MELKFFTCPELMRDKYFYPIPKENLIKRFQPAFEKLVSGLSATILSLPHTGRTSHLRFISSQPEFLKELGVMNDHLICFIETDRTNGSFESFIYEGIKLLDPENASAASQYTDPYLLSNEFTKLASSLSQSKKLIFIITLKSKIADIISEIDNLLVHTQKAARKNPISILWNIDTTTMRKFKSGHLSTTIRDNIFYFPTFSEDETLHSLKRIASLRGKSLDKESLQSAFSETGGIAAFFHDYINRESNISFNHNNDHLDQVIKDLKNECELNSEIIDKLTTAMAVEFVEKHSVADTTIKDFKFKVQPTAQEIIILSLLSKNTDIPVHRDDIAKSIWGARWERNYSDWAIDKAISRLRKNIISKDYKIITIKSLGYQLIKLT